MTNLVHRRQHHESTLINPILYNRDRIMHDVRSHIFHIRDWGDTSDTAITIYAEEYMNVIDYGLAYCGKHDQFSRTFGRDLARERLSDLYTNVQTRDNSPSKTGSIVAARKFEGSMDVKQAILSHMLYSAKNLPSWAVRSIKIALLNSLLSDYHKKYSISSNFSSEV